jgi:glyoxylase-like metal-dependent hydrolase (beta-lactamase superfamily II)
MKSDDVWMRKLSAHGLSLEDIDIVMCTHLHADHVGWNTRLEDGR